jgi:hypothetical protein
MGSREGVVMASQFVESEGSLSSSNALFIPESPFLETPHVATAEAEQPPLEHRFWEAESPFLHDVYALETTSPLAAEFSQLLAEMHDETFSETVRDMAAEAVAEHADQLNAVFPNPEAATAHAERVLGEHFAPLAEQAEMLLERFAGTLGRYDVQSLTAAEVDRLTEQFEPSGGQLSPTFEEFLGKLFNKAKSFVKGAVDLAKKGVGALGKLGLGPILNKLKSFVWPLLKRVIQFALNRLPESVRPLAQKLASKLLGTRAELEAWEGEAPGSLPAAATGEHIQLEFDVQVGQLLFASDEVELEQFASESTAQPTRYADPAGDLHQAREKLIGELGRLQRGQDASPAIQNFLPAALVALQPIAKIAITIIGRPKVVNFLAGLLAKLIQRYVGAEGAQLLSRAVVDVGLGLIGLEVTDQSRERLGYETIAATLEQTVTNLVTQPEYVFEDEALLEAAALHAFEDAVRTNFPSQLLKHQMRPTGPEGDPGAFLLMPKSQRRKYYKKYVPVREVEIPPPVAKEVKTFGMATLADFFRDQLLLPESTTVKAKLHIYEAICGTWLGYISQMETSVGGLGSHSRQAYYQFHPLTPEAAVALKVPGLGREVPPFYLAGHEEIAIGQRVYYLELPGQQRRQGTASYVRVEIDLRRYEIRLYIYLSERSAQEVAQQLRTSGAVAGALQTIAGMVGAFINTVRGGRAGRAVRVIRETPELEQLALPSAAAVLQGARSAAGALGNAVRGAVAAATGAAGSLSPGAGLAAGGLRAAAGGGAGGGGGGVAGAIGEAALQWLVEKVLDWANQALGRWLVENKDVFIRHASDPSKQGVTIIATFNPSQDLFRRILLATVFPAALALPVSRIELVAGPR